MTLPTHDELRAETTAILDRLGVRDLPADGDLVVSSPSPAVNSRGCALTPVRRSPKSLATPTRRSGNGAACPRPFAVSSSASWANCFASTRMILARWFPSRRARSAPRGWARCRR